MLVKNLPRMVRYLKDRGTYVLFNTNGTVLNERNGRALIAAELDELRVSFDAANAKSYLAVRGKNYFNRILKNVRAFRELQEREGHTKPRVSAWLTGLRETIEELPDFVRVAAETGVKEVYLQRLVFFNDNAIGKARPDQALYEQLSGEEAVHIDRAAALAKSLGITFSASGAASEPGMSLKRNDNGSPWSLCRRPWTVMYFTANGRALPCCIAPFSQRGYENYTLGDATQQTLREIWTGPAYSDFRKALLSNKPPARLRRVAACAGAFSDAAPARPRVRVVVVIPDVQRSGIDRRRGRRASARHRRPRHRGRWRQPRRHAGASTPRGRRGDRGRPRLWPRLPQGRASGGQLPTSSSSWTATAPTIRPASPRWSRRSAPAPTTSSSARAPAASASPAAWPAHQLVAGRIAGVLMRLLYGVRYTDMCAFRAIRRDTLLALGMRELTYGWNLEMQMRVARAGLRVLGSCRSPIAAASAANRRSPGACAARSRPG